MLGMNLCVPDHVLVLKEELEGKQANSSAKIGIIRDVL